VGRFIIVIGALALHIYVMLDVLRSPAPEVRILPRWLWFLVSLMPIVGPVGWLVVGRPRVGPAPGGGSGGGGGIGGGPRPGRGPLAPDDDPEFLKRLDEQSWAARMERLRREREGGTPPAKDTGGSPAGDPPADAAT